MVDANGPLVFASEEEFKEYMERHERKAISDILATLPENDPFFESFNNGIRHERFQTCSLMQ